MEVFFDDDHVFDEFRFTVEWCGLCGHHIRCPKCKNNCCNCCYGTVNGKECDICPLAYQYQKDMLAMIHRFDGLDMDDYRDISIERVKEYRKQEANEHWE